MNEVVTSYAEAPNESVTAGGVTFVYRDLGPRNGIPVVFLVHLAAVLDNWDPRVVDGIAAEHRVIAFDNRGVGGSSGTTPSTIEAMAADAVTFIEALGLEQVDLHGFSMGGMVAQVIAQTHPQLVRKLILTGTAPAGGKGVRPVVAVAQLDTVRGLLSRQDPKQFLFFTRTEAGKRAGKEFLARLEERTVDRDEAISPRSYLAQLRACYRWGASKPHDLSTIHHPVLLANGDHDRMLPTPNTLDMAQRLPDSELVIYPDAGHGGIFQFHDQFVQTALDFLDRDVTDSDRGKEEMSFATDTAITQIGPGRFTAELHEHWSSLVGIHGGYTAAIVANAVTAAVGDPSRALRSFATQFASIPRPGPVDVEVTVERTGRSMTTTSARLLQEGKVLQVAHAASSTTRPGLAYDDHVRPRDADPGDTPRFSSPDGVGHFQNADVRLDPGAVLFGGGREAFVAAWLRPLEGEPIGAAWLVAMCDLLPPAVFSRTTGPVAAATIEYVVHLATAEPSVPPGEYVYLSCRSPLSNEGFAVEDATMWAPDGRVLAVARQTRLAGA